MKNDLLRLPHCLRKMVGPKYYQIRCTKCSHVENVELCSCQELQADVLEGSDDTDFRKVGKVPQICPVCGGKVDSRQIPVSIHFL